MFDFDIPVILRNTSIALSIVLGVVAMFILSFKDKRQLPDKNRVIVFCLFLVFSVCFEIAFWYVANKLGSYNIFLKLPSLFMKTLFISLFLVFSYKDYYAKIGLSILNVLFILCSSIFVYSFNEFPSLLSTISSVMLVLACSYYVYEKEKTTSEVSRMISDYDIFIVLPIIITFSGNLVYSVVGQSHIELLMMGDDGSEAYDQSYQLITVLQAIKNVLNIFMKTSFLVALWKIRQL